MNYYEKNLGDYAKEAGHLSMAEHGAYNLLIDYYFANEKPVPMKDAHKIARARTPEDREIVDAVLAEFFELESDGCYHRKRCDEAIAAFVSSEPEREVKRTNEAGRQKKFREERNRLFAALHAVGQYPSWNLAMADLRSLHATHCVDSETSPEALRNASRNVAGNAPSTRDVTLQDEPATRDVTATNHHSQSPDTRHHTHTPISHTERAREGENAPRETGKGKEGKPDEPRQLTPEAAMSIPLREAGVKVTSIHPLLVAWVQDGFTVKQALAAVAVAREHKDEQEPIAAKYLDTILRNMPKPGKGNGAHAGARRPGAGTTHAEMMDALDAATDPDSEDFE